VSGNKTFQTIGSFKIQNLHTNLSRKETHGHLTNKNVIAVKCAKLGCKIAPIVVQIIYARIKVTILFQENQ